eukprot:TRINITY_DN12891_c0_g1_i1.p1 TRINITY_DN12891_c0_g1~~TRINITY_DN12891_c0_g1_i1.p1  ORF type:complete len:353 (-),score=52.13 TRINITY_DN12891_c0_g1_i1:87-1103(-)
MGGPSPGHGNRLCFLLIVLCLFLSLQLVGSKAVSSRPSRGKRPQSLARPDASKGKPVVPPSLIGSGDQTHAHIFYEIPPSETGVIPPLSISPDFTAHEVTVVKTHPTSHSFSAMEYTPTGDVLDESDDLKGKELRQATSERVINLLNNEFKKGNEHGRHRHLSMLTLMKEVHRLRIHRETHISHVGFITQEATDDLLGPKTFRNYINTLTHAYSRLIAPMSIKPFADVCGGHDDAVEMCRSAITSFNRVFYAKFDFNTLMEDDPFVTVLTVHSSVIMDYVTFDELMLYFKLLLHSAPATSHELDINLSMTLFLYSLHYNIPRVVDWELALTNLGTSDA